MFKKLFAIALFTSLTACGTLVGAGAGGYAGNQFGSGSGKAAATAAGVVGGGLLGHALTPNLPFFGDLRYAHGSPHSAA